MEWTGSSDGFNLALRLTQLRSAVRVGLALAARCPTEHTWEAALQDVELQETLSAFAAIVRDIEMALDHASPPAVMHTVMQHHQRSVEALDPFCETFGIDPDDLLVVLTS